MNYLGEIISLGVAFSWTITALASEVATKKLGVFVLNVWRMLLAFVLTGVLMYVFTGYCYPVYARWDTMFWLGLSGVVGYAMGDYCLFKSYVHIGSRYGQLFMTLAPMTAAVMAWVTLGQHLNVKSIIAIVVTLSGIALTILGKGEGKSIKLDLPLKGILFGIGAGVGQGVGLVLSKIGIDHYVHDLPPTVSDEMGNYVPFFGNMIRCVTGFVCFVLIMWFSQGWADFRSSVHKPKAMTCAVIAVIFGPALGVGFSLMAVQYTSAAIASTLMALTPIIIILPSRILFHQPITVKGVVGAVISVLGVSLFFMP